MSDVDVKGRISIDTGDTTGKIDATKKSMKGVADETKGATGNFGKLKESLGALPGPTGAATESLKGFKGLLDILKAHPILAFFALIVGVIVALFQHFKKMEGVSDSLSKAFSGLSTIFNFFLNKILKPLIDAFSTLVGWITDAAEWIADIFSPGLKEAADRAEELTEQLDDLEDAENRNALAMAESNRRLQEAREASEDATLTIQQRIEKLKEAGRIEDEELGKSIEIAQTRARIMLEQIALELDARDELIQKIREGTMEELKAARTEIYDMDEVDKEKIKKIDEQLIKAEEQGAARAKIAKKTQSAITSLEKEESDKREAAAKDAESKRKAAAQKAAQAAEAARREQVANQRAFEDKERKQRQDIELASINEASAKEFKVLQFWLDSETRANNEALKLRKLTREQYDQLQLQSLAIYNQKAEAIQKKYAEEQAARASADEAERLKIEEARKAADLKAEQDEARARRELRQRKLDFEISQADGELQVQKKLLDDKLAQLYQFYQTDLLNAGNNFMLRQQLEQKYTEDTAALARARQGIAEAEAAHKAAVVTETANIVGRAADIFGKQTVAGKALGIAQALINTYTGATDALRAKSVLPSPFDVVAKVINVAAVLKTGFDAVKAITRVQVPGGGGGISASAVSAITPVAPQQNSTQLNAGSIQGIGNAASGGVNRSFVLDADINNNADRAARLNRAARLG